MGCPGSRSEFKFRRSMSITLNAAAISTLTVGGVTVETDNTDAAMSNHIDFDGNTMFVVVQGGVLASGRLVPGTAGDSISITINLTSGAWFSNNGRSGTISGATLTNLVTMTKNMRNSIETFAVNNSVVNGTQVTWS